MNRFVERLELTIKEGNIKLKQLDKEKQTLCNLQEIIVTNNLIILCHKSIKAIKK